MVSCVQSFISKGCKYANKALYIFIKSYFFEKLVIMIKKRESNEDFRNFSGFTATIYMHALCNASTDTIPLYLL